MSEKKSSRPASPAPKKAGVKDVRGSSFSRRNGGTFFSKFSFLLKSRPFPVFGIIAALGTLIRLLVSRELIQFDSATYSPMPESDMATYIKIADGILQGKLPETFYYQPFYYSIFLPLCRIWGNFAGTVLTAIAQSFFGGAIIFLTGKVAMRTGGVFAGFSASLLAAFSAILIYFTPYALLEILQAFFIILLFDLVLSALEKNNGKRWAFAGLILGFSILTRGNTLFFFPVILAALFMQKSEKLSTKKKFFHAFLLTLFMLLPQIPFSLYNSFKTGHFSGPSTAGGAVLALGNNPEAAPAGLEIPHTPSWQEWMNKEKTVSIPERIFSYAMKEPGAWIELKCKQFLLFWGAEDHPNNISEEYNAVKSPIMQKKIFLPTGFIILLALSGLFAGFFQKYYLRRKSFLLLAAFLFVYALSVTAFYILARFRLPALPLMCAASGIFLARLFHFHSFSVRLRLILFLACGVFVTYALYPLYANVYEVILMKKILPHGVQVELENPHFPKAAYKNWNLSIMDASSMFQGGWTMMDIKENMSIRKVFSLGKNEQINASECGLVLPVTGSGSFTLFVNNKRIEFPAESGKGIIFNRESGNIPIEIETKDDGSKTITVNMTFCNVTGENMICFDRYRDYGRTFLDGKVLPCELALRILLPLKK